MTGFETANVICGTFRLRTAVIAHVRRISSFGGARVDVRRPTVVTTELTCRRIRVPYPVWAGGWIESLG